MKFLKNRRVLIAVLAAAAFLIGALIAFVIVNNDAHNTGSSSSKTSQAAPSNKDFAPVPTKNESFIINISIDGAPSDTAATLSYDGKGNSRYDFTRDGKHTIIYYTADYYYLCSGNDQCIKYPASQTVNSGFDPSLYQYDSARANQLKSKATYIGHAPCPAGTCDVWTFDNGDNKTKICTDINTGKLSFIEVTTADKVTKATYTYQPVTVTPPTNASTIPSI
jgi:hypothetical protein